MVFLKKIKDFIIGILLGSGAILPGISSGVLCIIFGIYDKLINSILGLFKNFKKNFQYLLPIALGGFVGVFLVSNILKQLFNNYPVQTSFCFIGLILGSMPLLIKKINSEHKFKPRYLFFTAISFTFGYLLVILESKLNFSNTVSNFSNGFLVLSGFLMSARSCCAWSEQHLDIDVSWCLPCIFKRSIWPRPSNFNSNGNRSSSWLHCIFGYNKSSSTKILHADILFYYRFYFRQHSGAI